VSLDDLSARRVSRYASQLVRAVELYDAWLFAEADATLALATWRDAPTDDKRCAYAAYLAALDRETLAAELLERGIARAA
jgi:hypothetical protein